MKADRLAALFSEMQSASEGITYFAVNLTADENCQILVGSKSAASGVTESEPCRELRSACQVKGQVLLDLWVSTKMKGVAVNTLEHLRIFVCIGGNAIIEESLAREYFPQIFEKKVIVPTGLASSATVENVHPSELKRSPTPKKRMAILKRDEYRCRVCGRSPNDSVDIQLRLHHFIPWAKGGLTNERNLMTLWHTCHDGLDPHFEPQLSNIFRETFDGFNEFAEGLKDATKRHHEAVLRYRDVVRQRPNHESEE